MSNGSSRSEPEQAQADVDFYVLESIRWLEEAWRRHFPELYRHSLAWADGRREDAEDALGQAAMIAVQKPPRGLRPEAALGWLLCLIRHQCINLHRERRRRLRLAGELGGVGAGAGGNLETGLLDRELKAFVHSSIQRMPARLRSVAELHLLHELGYAEISARLEITEANVRKRMQEARASLRGLLRAYLAGEAGLRAAWSGEDAVAAPAGRGARHSGKRPGEPPGETPRRKRWSLAALQAYVHRHPRGWKMRWELARRLRAAGHLEEAAQHLRLALERQPARAELRFELSAVLSALGRGAEAAAVYQEAPARTGNEDSRRELQERIVSCRDRGN
jgi:RNA polymerase sigma-70 factor (ECF subfamily)